MEIKIYGLIDPRTQEVRYIGKTKKKLNQRLKEHISDKPIHNTHKYNWVLNLKKENLVPIIIEIESCNETNWVEKEKYWILQFRNLTNLTSGGEGINFFTEEVLLKISNAVKKVWENQSYRDNQLEKTIKYWSDNENRLNHGLKIKGIKRSDEFKENLSNIKKEQWNDNEYKSKMSKQSADLWEDEDYRKKVTEKMQTPEYKKKISDTSTGRVKSKQVIDKMRENSPKNKPIMIDGVEYISMMDACRKLNMKKGKIETRLKSKNFTEYFHINKNGECV